MAIEYAREFERRYRGTYVGIKTDKHIVTAHVDGIRDGEVKNTIVWIFNGRKEPITTSVNVKEIEKSIQLLPLTFGMISVSGFLYYLYKRPFRQFKAGYHSDNMAMYSLQSHEIRMVGKRGADIDSSGVINFIFNPTYHTLSDGLKLIDSGKILGFPLNRKFGVGLVRGYERPCVFYKQYNLGPLTANHTVVLTPAYHHLLEELSQYVRCECGE